jgi:hypothetical protein
MQIEPNERSCSAARDAGYSLPRTTTSECIMEAYEEDYDAFDYLPDELWEKIFALVPTVGLGTQSLLKCLTVSRAWKVSLARLL